MLCAASPLPKETCRHDKHGVSITDASGFDSNIPLLKLLACRFLPTAVFWNLE